MKEWLRTVTIGVDRGCGTIDLASIMLHRLRPFVGLGELVPANGSACGSHRLNQMFVDLVRESMGFLYSQFVAAVGVSEIEFADHLFAGFERFKKRFDNTQPPYRIGLDGLRLPTVGYDFPGLKVLLGCLEVSR